MGAGAALILALADRRTYAAEAELRAGAGTQFDPMVVDACLRCALGGPKVTQPALDRLSSVG